MHLGETKKKKKQRKTQSHRLHRAWRILTIIRISGSLNKQRNEGRNNEKDQKKEMHRAPVAGGFACLHQMNFSEWKRRKLCEERAEGGSSIVKTQKKSENRGAAHIIPMRETEKCEPHWQAEKKKLRSPGVGVTIVKREAGDSKLIELWRERKIKSFIICIQSSSSTLLQSSYYPFLSHTLTTVTVCEREMCESIWLSAKTGKNSRIACIRLLILILLRQNPFPLLIMIYIYTLRLDSSSKY